MTRREELEAELAKLDQIEKDNIESVETEEFVSLSELSGKSNEEIIFEKDIKYYVQKQGDKLLLKGKIKVTNLFALYLIDIMKSLEAFDNISSSNIDKITTLEKLDTILEKAFDVTEYNTGEVYEIKDPVEKLETVTAIIKLATPTINEEAAKLGNRATRRAAQKQKQSRL